MKILLMSWGSPGMRPMTISKLPTRRLHSSMCQLLDLCVASPAELEVIAPLFFSPLKLFSASLHRFLIDAQRSPHHVDARDIRCKLSRHRRVPSGQYMPATHNLVLLLQMATAQAPCPALTQWELQSQPSRSTPRVTTARDLCCFFVPSLSVVRRCLIQVPSRQEPWE